MIAKISRWRFGTFYDLLQWFEKDKFSALFVKDVFSANSYKLSDGQVWNAASMRKSLRPLMNLMRSLSTIQMRNICADRTAVCWVNLPPVYPGLIKQRMGWCNWRSDNRVYHFLCYYYCRACSTNSRTRLVCYANLWLYIRPAFPLYILVSTVYHSYLFTTQYIIIDRRSAIAPTARSISYSYRTASHVALMLHFDSVASGFCIIEFIAPSQNDRADT